MVKRNLIDKAVLEMGKFFMLSIAIILITILLIVSIVEYSNYVIVFVFAVDITLVILWIVKMVDIVNYIIRANKK